MITFINDDTVYATKRWLMFSRRSIGKLFCATPSAKTVIIVRMGGFVNGRAVGRWSGLAGVSAVQRSCARNARSDREQSGVVVVVVVVFAAATC